MDNGDVPTTIPQSAGQASASPIVVGTDGSVEAGRGMLFAANLALTLGVELVVVHALGMYSQTAGWRVPVEEHEAEATALLRDTWCAPLDDVDGLRWEGRVVQGVATEAVLRVADDVDAGFVVVGSHGAGNSDEPLLGSTSYWIVRNSHRPVIIVPPPDNHRHRRAGVG